MKNKLYKILSLTLSIIMILSICILPINVAAVDENAYYVINGGTGNGKTVDTPAGSVADAITAINADNLTANDTANIYIMQRDDWNTDTTAGNAHKITYWGADGTVPAHEAKIVVQSYGDAPNYLAYNSKAKYAKSLYLNGPTEFKNVILVCTRGKEDSILTNDFNVVFGEGTKYGQMPDGNFTGNITEKLSAAIGIGNSESSTTDNISLSFENDYYSYGNDSGRSFIYLGRVNSKRKYTGAYNISFDLASTSDVPRIHVGSTNSGSATVYDNDLNLNFKSANKFAFIRLSTYGSFTVNGALQIIKNKDAQLCKLPAISTAGKDITESYSFDDITVNGGKWILTNTTDNKNFISTTETAGTFKIATGSEAKATDKEGTDYYSVNGELQIPAGEYTIETYIQTQPGNYYVINGGQGTKDGKSPENAAASVADAITAINADNLTTDDTATIHIMQRDDWNTDTTAGNAHKITYWGADGTVPAHEAKIVVQSYGDKPNYLAYNSKAKYAKSLYLNGPTEFKNIVLVCTRGRQDSILTNDFDVTFGEGTTYGYMPNGDFKGTITAQLSVPTGVGGSVTSTTNNINVNFENDYYSYNSGEDYTRTFIYLGRVNSKRKYTGSYNYTFNLTNTNAVPRMYVGSTNSKNATVYDNDLNFNFKSANKFAFIRLSTYGSFTVNGALQIIKNKDAKLCELPATNTSGANLTGGYEFDDITVNGGKWILTNNAGNSNFISYTSTAGTYTIAEGSEAKATDDNGTDYFSVNGVLTIPEGKYIIEEYFAPTPNDYYVINGGQGTKDGKSPENAAASVADAITAINADNLTANDTANIYIMQRDDWDTNTTASNAHKITYWGADGTVPVHEAKIVVQSYGDAPNYLAYNSKAKYAKSLYLNGPTEFKNVILVCTRGRQDSILTNDCDVTFGAGTTYGYMPDGDFKGTIEAQLSAPTGVGSSAASTTDNINVSFENDYYSYNFGADYTRTFIYLGRVNSKRKYTGTYNYTFDLSAENSVPRMYVGSTNSKNATVYDNDLNFNFKSANKFAFIRLSTYGSFTVNGALQIIKNKDAKLCELPATNTSGANLTGGYEFDDITVNGGRWILTNASGVKDIIEFTDTEGKYSVKEGYDVTAVNDKTNESVDSENGFLVITEGNWTIVEKGTIVIPQTPKMLHLDTTSGKEFMQRVPVVSGETYNFTFSLSDSLSYFSVICLNDGKRNTINANTKLINKVDHKGYSTYTYSYTIPEKDAKGEKVASLVFFGLRFSGKREGYFFSPSVNKANDDTKQELLTNYDFRSGLDEWAWSWNIWFRGENIGKFEWSNSKTTLKLLEFDLSIFDKIDVKNKQMLYIKTTGPKDLMQRALVTPGQTYHFTFSLNDTITSVNPVCRTDGSRYTVSADIELVSSIKKDGYTTYTYSYKIPETYIGKDGKVEPMTSYVFVGFRPNVSCEGYMFDVSFTNVEDKFKMELFANANFNFGLDEWAWEWQAWFRGTLAGLTEWTNGDSKTTLKTMDFDKTLIDKLNATIPGKQMIYYNNAAVSAHFAARVSVKPSESYYLKFSAYSTADIAIKIAKDGQRANIMTAKTELVKEDKFSNYTTYTYKITMPDDLDSSLVFVGPLLRYYSEGYLFDLSFYKENDAKKTNLYANDSFAIGLDGWIFNWHAWFGYDTDTGLRKWTDGSRIVEAMDFDLSKIDKLIAELNVDDGVWWNSKDIIEDLNVTKASLLGTIVDQDGNPINNIKFSLDSEEINLETTSNSKGEFEFRDFPEGFYELFTVNDSGEKIRTDFYATFEDGDVVKLKLTCDVSATMYGSVGSVLGTVYTPQLKTVKNLKIHLGNVAETKTDENGNFEFLNIPVGDYEIYTILEDGSKYILRKVSVKENVELKIKLKYAPEIDASANSNNNFNWLWIIIPSICAIILAGGTVTAIIIIKKKKALK